VPSCKYYGTHVRAIGTTSAFLLADFINLSKGQSHGTEACSAVVWRVVCNADGMQHYEGAGKDIQRGGEKVESAADKNKKIGSPNRAGPRPSRAGTASPVPTLQSARATSTINQIVEILAPRAHESRLSPSSSFHSRLQR
jgi:hypothetical protein